MKKLNGYEFTRFEADYTNELKAQQYEASIVAFKCEEAFGKSCKDYHEDPDYIDSTHWFIETTMSCCEDEAINWMKYYMANAIAYGIETKNLDWRTKFLAAWDLFLSLTDGKYAANSKEIRFNQVC